MQAPIRIPQAPGWVAEFRAFIMRGNVVDLAVGIIIGVAFSGIVNSLVKDILNPIIGRLVGGVDFSNIFVALNGQHYATLDAAQKAAAPTVNIGVFINTIINFLIISFAIFWVVKAMSRLVRKEAPPEPVATPTEVLLTEIRDLLASRSPPAPPAR
ncbi:MAG TPA: large conductance mechanosensitive channel protein MscL [Rhodopila sp.]|nr:large conductance mechanosensitive channel protein MscL [Rhodopila sp.]